MKYRFVKGVKDVLRQAGVEASQYSGHSFMIGATTVAGRNGLSSEKKLADGRVQHACSTSDCLEKS